MSYSDPFGLCKVQVGYKNVDGAAPFEHAFIVMTPPDATATVYRGGPTNPGLSGGTDAQGAIPHGGSIETKGYGPIKVQDYPQYSPQDNDTPHAIRYDAPLVNNDKPCDNFQASFNHTMAAIKDKKIAYDPLAQNSNSVVNT
ncbi:MAG: hypothetical protein ACRENQ_08465, partial [Gemmatimonadaceae bacterium]